MSQPPGPTGVITLKKIADMTYEQYGAIVLSTTGVTQVTMSSDVADQLFQPNIEDQITWIEEFSSRIQGAPHQDSQSSFHNDGTGAWQGGAWGVQGVANVSLVPQATLSGSVRQFLQTSGAGLPDAVLQRDEATIGTNQITAHVNRNPTFYIRWAHAGDTQGGLRAIGWRRRGETFTQSTGPLGGIYFRWRNAGDIEAVCITHAGFTKFMTTLSMGVTVATGSYHTGRMVVTNNLANQMILGEYIGDGSSPRSLVVTNYTPICVWVLGTDGSSNEIGAFKIAGMPTGVSHPWVNNPATGAPSRSNRILSLDARGFTVGPDLNTTGRPYFYITYPSVSGFSAVGSYTGDGVSLESAVALDTTGGDFVAGSAMFGPEHIGKVVVRTSDFATIGTVTGVTDSTHATGTVLISGVFAAADWHWEPRQVPIGFQPDFAMLCSTISVGVLTPAPAQFSPGRALSDTFDLSGTTQNMMGDSINPANALIASNSANLQVKNNTGTAGWNLSGQDYFWFAFRTGSSAIPFEKIDYTGDGLPGRVLSGASFTPSFWMGFGKDDTPQWKTEPTLFTVSPGTNTYQFVDGNPPVAANVTFGAGTVTLGAGNLNFTNRLYRAYVASDSGAARGPSVEFFIDGVSRGVISTNVPDEGGGFELSPGFGSTNANDPGGIMDVDYMALSQKRTPS